MALLKKPFLFSALLLLLVGAGAASATVMEADVPFPFVVHGRTLPAGRYELQRSEDDPSVMLIREKDGAKEHVLVLTTTAPGHDPAGQKSALEFKRRDDQYYLADVWRSGSEGWHIAGSQR
jgi:hypothetical protein